MISREGNVNNVSSHHEEELIPSRVQKFLISRNRSYNHKSLNHNPTKKLIKHLTFDLLGGGGKQDGPSQFRHGHDDPGQVQHGQHPYHPWHQHEPKHERDGPTEHERYRDP